MREIVRLTETDLRTLVIRVIEEQSNECSKVRITKNMIDSFLPKIKDELKSRIEGLKKEILSKVDSSLSKKILEIFNNSINENFNLILNIGLKINYAKFGVTGPYNSTSDIQTLVNNIVNKIKSNLTSNLLYKAMLKVYIDKKNINDVKKMTDDSLTMSFRELNRLLLSVIYGFRNEVQEKVGRCPNGEEYKVLVFNKNYTQYSVGSYYDTIKSDLFKILDSYV
jgi:hypothetical protein